MKTLLFDIEGTTTDIHFVHKVLFPYSLKKMRDFVLANPNHSALLKVKETLKEEKGVEDPDLNTIADILIEWIQNDRKHGALKEIQGEIWKEGYEQGDFKGHLYPDVLPSWKKWKEEGFQICIYSSGSVQAQKLIFGYSEEGDLTPLISHYFDTQVGAKRESQSYENIKKVLGNDVTFFSDIKEELDAAQMAGFKTVQVFRNESQSTTHQAIKDFSEYKA